jgi:hypothetical protein
MVYVPVINNGVMQLYILGYDRVKQLHYALETFINYIIERVNAISKYIFLLLK